jgi:hypothetical protein
LAKQFGRHILTFFLIKEHPTASDKNAIEGKFKSYHNASDNAARLMTKTFYALLQLADLSATPSASPELDTVVRARDIEDNTIKSVNHNNTTNHGASLHYNIQIHLPYEGYRGLECHF